MPKFGYRKDWNITFSLADQQYIKDNCYYVSDAELAKKFGVSLWYVTEFRKKVLNIHKSRLSFQTRLERKVNAVKELDALLNYEYNGIMLDSMNHRIEFLKAIIYTK